MHEANSIITVSHRVRFCVKQAFYFRADSDTFSRANTQQMAQVSVRGSVDVQW